MFLKELMFNGKLSSLVLKCKRFYVNSIMSILKMKRRKRSLQIHDMSCLVAICSCEESNCRFLPVNSSDLSDWYAELLEIDGSECWLYKSGLIPKAITSISSGLESGIVLGSEVHDDRICAVDYSGSYMPYFSTIEACHSLRTSQIKMPILPALKIIERPSPTFSLIILVTFLALGQVLSFHFLLVPSILSLVPTLGTLSFSLSFT
ncbi:hypothetical protein L1987_34567 [Smallanthus sonchifolius]|uniref:Uncharacterized protein n=1 Tax=Smallanthus sonchifolius TaxID=185202 RepID=A0ACB9HU07_9ASTR|nr:hypothetical protein L1987_34567 [Smallanthus sonchifolius]